jgi:hypothetical protein
MVQTSILVPPEEVDIYFVVRVEALARMKPCPRFLEFLGRFEALRYIEIVGNDMKGHLLHTDELIGERFHFPNKEEVARISIDLVAGGAEFLPRYDGALHFRAERYNDDFTHYIYPRYSVVVYYNEF